MLIKVRMLLLACLLLATACHKGTNTHDRYRYHRTTKTTPSGRTNKGDSGRDTGNMTEDWSKLNVKLEKTDNPQLYAELKTWLGTPHVGGRAEKGTGTDCSGMVMKVYLAVYGIPLERNAARMYKRNCSPISRNQLREGDLVFFHGSTRGEITHVGIYLKEGKFVHTSSSRGVRVSDLTQGYFDKHYECAGRVLR